MVTVTVRGNDPRFKVVFFRVLLLRVPGRLRSHLREVLHRRKLGVDSRVFEGELGSEYTDHYRYVCICMYI